MAQSSGASVIRLAPPVAAPGKAGLVRIPCPGRPASVRLAPLAARDRFLDPGHWQLFPMVPDAQAPGWQQLDVESLGLPDGDYEYDLQLAPDLRVADPFAEEIVRFGGYRSLLRLRGGRRWRPPFSWEGELATDGRLPQNHELVIYEVPLRWMDTGDQEQTRQVGLGTFDKLLFEHLNAIQGSGANAIELLPCQDSPDTLNWGYGTRFFFVTDKDLGRPVDMKVLVKECHRRGMRVILDVVMNHSRDCPLSTLARDWYYAQGNVQPGRNGWGGDLFWFDQPVDGRYWARELFCSMGEFWVSAYHVDGFRIDEFKGIQNWEFIQQFRDRTTLAQQDSFPDRPFIVIAEDSGRNAAITQDQWPNPGSRRTVDAAWNFAYQDDVRALLTDSLETTWGDPSRADRVRAAVSAAGVWDGYLHALRPGFTDMAQAVNYVTSHDVQSAPRLANLLMGRILERMGVAMRGWQEIRDIMDQVPAPRGQDDTVLPGFASDAQRRAAREETLDRAAGAFALLLTSVGIPMSLAGEEFGDVHDTEYSDWRLKMSDPVSFARRDLGPNAALRARVGSLAGLRRTHPALLRNEVEFFYFHPRFDAPAAERVFAYCRTAARPLGSDGQVIVLANMGPQHYPQYFVPSWPWSGVAEVGAGASAGPVLTVPGQPGMTTSLAPFQVRVFST